MAFPLLSMVLVHHDDGSSGRDAAMIEQNIPSMTETEKQSEAFEIGHASLIQLSTEALAAKDVTKALELMRQARSLMEWEKTSAPQSSVTLH